jgi:hypothetical protein
VGEYVGLVGEGCRVSESERSAPGAGETRRRNEGTVTPGQLQ